MNKFRTALKSMAIAGLVWAAPVWAGENSAHEHHHHHHHAAAGNMDTSRPPALNGSSIYQLGDTWKNQEGKATQLSSLAGHPTVVAMVFTSCQSACPLIVSDLKAIEKGLPERDRKQLRFAIFSFDSDRDTPERLKKFAQERELDLGRFTLFQGKPTSVRKLAAVLGIRYQKNERGDFDHSNVITVLNEEGVIQHQQVGLRQNPEVTQQELKNLLSQQGR